MYIQLSKKCLFALLVVASFFSDEAFAHDSLPAQINIHDFITKLPARNIGPHGRNGNGRVTAIAVYPKDARIFFVATASGGVFRTETRGMYFAPFFDSEGSSSIGAVAVSATDPNIVWVGTGEGWHRNSAGIGDGIYKTTDGGKTWKKMGLANSQSFSKIIIHPKNSNIVFAAALGSQWMPGNERGVYKTTDGGQTWKRVLYVNDLTGVADISIDPKDPKKLIAAMWEHQRRPYAFISGGQGSGIFYSTNGGETWKRSLGLPDTALGRIALDIHPRKNVAVASVEQKPNGGDIYISKDGGKSWEAMHTVHLDRKGKPEKYQDGQWYRPFYNNLVCFDPFDPNIIYQANYDHFSKDGGRTFVGSASDDHVLWINPNDRNHVMHGDDGGVTVYSDGHNGAIKGLVLPSFAQCYGVGFDMRKLYRVITNSQDMPVMLISTQSHEGVLNFIDTEKLPDGDEAGTSEIDPNNWSTLYTGGRSSTLYRYDLKKAQIKKISPFERMTDYASPDRKKYFESEHKFRASWYSKFIISSYNSHTLYYAANKILKSTDRGDNWQVISPDLTQNKPEWQVPSFGFWGLSGGLTSGSGAETYQCVVAIDESPLKPGLIWVGSDDGLVHVTSDDGKNWINVTENIPGLPKYSWCSSVEASAFSADRAYATFNNYRNGDLSTYVYMTDDKGKSWKKINGDLPSDEICYIVKEGLKNPDLLFLGTEHGLFISMDRGNTWGRYKSWTTGKGGWGNEGYFPTVAVYDIDIHPIAQDLIVSTHGRGIWTIPINSLEDLTKVQLNSEVEFNKPGTVYLLNLSSDAKGFMLEGGNENNSQPGTLMSYYLKNEIAGGAIIRITDPSGKTKIGTDIHLKSNKGLNTFRWSGDIIKTPGDYRLTLTVGGKEYYQTLHVEDAREEIGPAINLK